MKGRSLVRKRVIQAWEQCIEKDYGRQRINSERSLQASFWAQLNEILSETSRRLFIEPRLELKVNGKRKVVYPDIVICNTKQVIAVVELKYQPRTLPSIDKDLKTLQLVAKYRKQLTVSNWRHLGPISDGTTYTFSQNFLFVWAGVHKRPAQGYDLSDDWLFSAEHPVLSGCFLELHAETDLELPPHVFHRPT